MSYAQNLFKKIGASHDALGTFQEPYLQECNELRALSQYLDALVDVYDKVMSEVILLQMTMG
jgi:hypothetical protein